MSRDRWRRIEDICHDALERSTSDRAAFVRDACAGDTALRAEVESLLANQSCAEALGSGLGIRDSGLGIRAVFGRFYSPLSTFNSLRGGSRDGIRDSIDLVPSWGAL